MNSDICQNRRQFIQRTLATTGALGLGTHLRSAQVSRQPPIDSKEFANLRSKVKGRLILPTDTGYDEARRVFFWNPDTERRPALIARCAHEDDVLHAVGFAHRHGLEVAVRAAATVHWAGAPRTVSLLTRLC
jgi:hypothetical protein